MGPQLVTQLDLDAPLVVVVGYSSALQSEMVQAISQMGLQTKIIAPNECQQASSQELFSQAYKIIFLVSTFEYFPKNIHTTTQALQQFSKKVSVLHPIVDGIATISDTVFHRTWKKVSDLQESVILEINSILPDALFVFAKNVLGTDAFLLDFLTLHVSKKIVYDPDFEVTLLTVEAFVQQSVPLFFKPSPQHSFCFTGEKIHSTQVAEEIIRLFTAYYQQTLVKKYEQTEVTSGIPFPVVEKQLSYISAQKCVDTFVRMYPHSPAAHLESSTPQIQLKQVALPTETEKTQEYYPSTQTDSQKRETPTSQSSKELFLDNFVEVPEPQSFQAHQSSRRDSELQFELQTELPVRKTDTFLEENSKIPSKKTPEDTVQKRVEPTIQPKKVPLEKKDLPQDTVFDVGHELSKIFAQPRTAEKVARVEKMAHTERTHIGKSKRKKVLFYGGLGFIGSGFGIVVLLLVFVATQFFVKRQLFAVAKTAVHSTVSVQDQKVLQNAASFLEVQTKSYGSLFDLALISDAEHLLDVTAQLTNVSLLLEEMELSTQTLYYRLLGLEEGSVFEVSTQLSSQAETAYENLSLVQAGIEQIPFDEEDTEKENIIISYQEKIDEVRNRLITQRQVLPLMETIFGGSKKTYLILFQNEQELRPTGGFIQAAAIVTFSDGTLISSQVFSSYDVDALVSGNVAPPEDLPRFLGEQQWFFRDSNWNPDFTQSAAKASWFMGKATGSKIDGVIALTLDATGDMIDALGPLEITEHNEVVTSKNLNALMEHHSEKLLVTKPEEKAYPVVLMEGLLDKVKTAQPEKITGLLTTIHENLEEKDMLITSTDDTVQELLTTLGWTGALVKPECPLQFTSQICTVDAIAQVATNTGVNKANYYLDERINHTVELLPGVAQHTRTIQIENTADINAWPKGDYRAYYRFYLNASAQVTEVTINNRKISDSDLVERVEQGRAMVGFLVTVPIQAQTEVVLKYSVPLSGEAGYSYSFFDQKQPGTDIPTTVTLVPYSGLKPAKIAPQAEVTSGGIVFDTQNRKSHGFYGVEFR